LHLPPGYLARRVGAPRPILAVRFQVNQVVRQDAGSIQAPGRGHGAYQNSVLHSRRAREKKSGDGITRHGQQIRGAYFTSPSRERTVGLCGTFVVCCWEHGMTSRKEIVDGINDSEMIGERPIWKSDPLLFGYVFV
jgi:hypothetical protein